MIYKHYSEVPWDKARWPNFSSEELACPCCGEFYYEEESFDLIQKARDIFKLPISINSAHRCVAHNSKVGGAVRSRHLKIAFDVPFKPSNRLLLQRSLLEAGFTTFGYYGTFLHVDIRKGRRWYSKEGRTLWLSGNR